MSHAQLSRSSSECRIYANLIRYASYRQIGGTRSYMGPYIDRYGIKAAKASFKCRNFTLYQGFSFPNSTLQSLPKIFSCSWIDDNRILLGCRDGSVHIADLTSFPWTIRTLSSSTIAPTAPGPGGVLAMRKNDTLGLLASSYGDGKSVAVWDTESLRERCQFKGFNEFVYDADWLDERTFVAVGQKSEYSVWRLSLNALEKGFANPVACRKEASGDDFSDDWRQSRCCEWSKEHSACLVGNNNSIASFDPREQRMQFLNSFTEHRSVRSISADGHRITFTTSSGKVAFMDFRMPGLLPTSRNVSVSTTPKTWLHRSKNYYQVLDGYSNPTEFFTAEFSNLTIEQALFTHAYDSSGMRLFVGGGPSLQGIEGSTAGILF